MLQAVFPTGATSRATEYPRHMGSPTHARPQSNTVGITVAMVGSSVGAILSTTRKPLPAVNVLYSYRILKVSDKTLSKFQQFLLLSRTEKVLDSTLKSYVVIPSISCLVLIAYVTIITPKFHANSCYRYHNHASYKMWLVKRPTIPDKSQRWYKSELSFSWNVIRASSR